MKLLFTDLDGTLLNSQKEISPADLEAIATAGKQGNMTVVTTGRSLSSAMPYIQKTASVQKDCYAVLYNGGLIYDCKAQKPIFQKTIPLPYVEYIFQQAEKFNLHCQTYEEGYVLAPRDRAELREYASHTGMPIRIIPDPVRSLTSQPYKVLTSCIRNRALHEEYRQSLESWAKDKLSLFFSSGYYLEHVPLGVSKGSAITFLCEHLGVPLENTVAAGDAENDISMLETAKIGAAMVNGTAQVKEAADYVTVSDNDHGGISEIIGRFLLDSR